MRILSLDLGTTTGWALWDDGVLTSGSWELMTTKELEAQRKKNLDRCCDQRPTRLLEHIKKMLPVDHIFFEDVLFVKSALQAQLWASLRAMIQLQYPNVQVACIDVQALKKFAGKGGADKEHMAQFLVKKHPTRYLLRVPEDPKWVACRQIRATDTTEPGALDLISPRLMDDNEVDALHLMDYALKELHANPIPR